MATTARNKSCNLSIKYVGGAALGFLIFIGVPESARWVHGGAFAQSPQPFPGGNNNTGIITNNQSGGANTVIQGTMQRHLGNNEKEQLLARLNKTRNISVTVVLNDAEANNLATEIANFLKNAGYTVNGPNGAMMWTSANTSPKGVNINLNEDKPQNPVEITVGINATP
jgi:hypothetical protein